MRIGQEMRIAKLTLLFLTFILILSIFVANVVNIIDVDSHAAMAVDQLYAEKLQAVQDSRWSQPRKFDIGQSYDHLLWFIQITDLHISIFRDPTRITELKEFCDKTLKAINPEIVLASGDLTDAKTSDKMGSRQILQEWQNYKSILEDAKVTDRTVWLDVRGNHDNFNIYDMNSTENYFKNYSIMGKKHPRSYMHQAVVGSNKYTFIAVDACLNPGPRRPFNFVGNLDAAEINRLHEFANKSRETNGDFIIWFGHYPTSCIMSESAGGLRGVIGKYEESMTYLCGHFHTLGGTVPNMYSIQQNGFLELELADWKDARMYRIGVIDHGQFSFVDVGHREWPVGIVTNPKNAQFAMPKKENLQSIVDSTHIRALAFSLAEIKSVKVRIDNEKWMDCNHVKGPLYVVEWNSSNYKTGIHCIQIHITDSEGREKTTSQPFSLDHTRISFGVVSRILLMSNVTHIFQFLFGTLLVLLIVPLCILRIVHMSYTYKRLRRPKIRIALFNWWLRNNWIIASVDRLFFPIIVYALYLPIGPLAVGEIIDNHVGVIFAWGIYIGEHFLPGSFTYAYAFFQLLSFHLPLTLVIGHRIGKRLYWIEKPRRKSIPLFQHIWEHMLFILLMLMQLGMIYYFWLAYGTLATLVCPLRTWSVILAVTLWYQVHRMPQECLRPAARIWSSHGPLVVDREEIADKRMSPIHEREESIEQIN